MLFFQLGEEDSIIQDNFFIGSSRYFPDRNSRVNFTEYFYHDGVKLPTLEWAYFLKISSILTLLRIVETASVYYFYIYLCFSANYLVFMLIS